MCREGIRRCSSAISKWRYVLYYGGTEPRYRGRGGRYWTSEHYRQESGDRMIAASEQQATKARVREARFATALSYLKAPAFDISIAELSGNERAALGARIMDVLAARFPRVAWGKAVESVIPQMRIFLQVEGSNLDDRRAISAYLVGVPVNHIRSFIRTAKQFPHLLPDIMDNPKYRLSPGFTSGGRPIQDSGKKKKPFEEFDRAVSASEVHMDILEGRIGIVSTDIRAVGWLSQLRALRTRVSRMIRTLEKSNPGMEL